MSTATTSHEVRIAGSELVELLERGTSSQLRALTGGNRDREGQLRHWLRTRGVRELSLRSLHFWCWLLELDSAQEPLVSEIDRRRDVWPH